MMSWTYWVSVYLGGRHWAHDRVYGVVHEAVGHAVLLDDVLAYWSEMGKNMMTQIEYDQLVETTGWSIWSQNTAY